MRNVYSGSICSSVTFSLGRSFYVTSPTWLSSRCRGFLPGSIFGESNGRIRCWLAGLPFPWVVLSDCRWRYFRLPSSGNPQSAGAYEQIPSSRSSAIGGRRFTVQRNIISRVPSFFQVLRGTSFARQHPRMPLSLSLLTWTGESRAGLKASRNQRFRSASSEWTTSHKLVWPAGQLSIPAAIKRAVRIL